MSAYYNERDPYAAQWLRNLIAAGHIAPGDVDERSITEIQPDDLRGYTQCHFFAGVGVWSHALRRAGWADDLPVWTGSRPCQPFSAAGQQKGFDDERHLWPVWFDLIRQCRPATVLGEQVASALDWLDLVSTDLEGAGYAFGASDLCAAGFGGAHIRQRLYFVALADTNGRGQPGTSRSRSAQDIGIAERGGTGGLADAQGSECERGEVARQRRAGVAGGRAVSRGLADTASRDTSTERQQRGGQHGLQPESIIPVRSGDSGSEHRTDPELDRPHAPLLGRNPADWLYSRDGKWRPVEPGTFPLADAAPARVGRLRAYGNALDAETASQFCGAVMECLA